VNDPGRCLPEPRSIAETGLSFGFLVDLVLKVIYFANELTGQGVVDHLKLPFAHVVEELLAFLTKDDMLAITGSTGFGERAYKYAVTGKGIAKAQEVLARCQYAGPAPVSLKASIAMTHSQSIGEVRVSQSQMHDGFQHLVISDEMLSRVGPAVNSARSIFLYGPPGNGKTTVAEGISKLLGGTVHIPYVVEVDGQVIKVFDEVNHKPLPEPPRTSPGFGADPPAHDRRWVLCQRPLIEVGGELTLAGLDLVFDPISKTYEAPFQMKANSGMLLIDDFGRQQVSPRDLLNRWIVPLEKRVDYLTLQTGKKIEIPFDVLIVFSTNLDPSQLVDDAFLRRIRHKILVPDPTWDQFREVFQRLCPKRGVEYSEENLQYLVQKHYLGAQRTPKMVHPRDLLDQIVDAARYLDVPPAMSKDLLDRAVEAYFVKLGGGL
jgi:predicted ATPase with chaperone activity